MVAAADVAAAAKLGLLLGFGFRPEASTDAWFTEKKATFRLKVMLGNAGALAELIRHVHFQLACSLEH